MILADRPFRGKERNEVQKNFPIRTAGDPRVMMYAEKMAGCR
jgi:hypothetical protein